MATLRSSGSTTTARSSSDGSDESIMNRKIERKGLPGSFSANLGRRTSGPRRSFGRETTSSQGNGSTSVKAIVAWLESSKDDTRSFTPLSSDPQIKNLLVTSTPPKSIEASTSPPTQQGISTVPDVENYSLTLLKYREYFTERPLARCLDQQEDPLTTTVSTVKATNNHQSPHDSSTESEIDVASISDSSVQSQQIRSRQGSESDANAASSNISFIDGTQEDSSKPLPRDIKQVDAFWGAVRSFLRVSNEELEQGQVAEQLTTFHDPPSSRFTLVINSTSPSAFGSHPAQVQTSPRCDQANAEGPSRFGHSRGRKRLLSVEEKISEIDAFLGTK